MKHEILLPEEDKKAYDQALSELDAKKDDWAQLPVSKRIRLLKQVKKGLSQQAENWVKTASLKKEIPEDSPLSGEEWLSGPYAVMSACNGYILTLSQMKRKSFLARLPHRYTRSGQLALKVIPHNMWDRLLFAGMKAEVWMERGITKETLKAASTYDTRPSERKGRVALVLGAGNIASISPLDAFQKLFIENEVVLLKLNPVNDYLYPFLKAALQPLIDCNALRIVLGDGVAGSYLTNHPLVYSIHITGAGATHDAIVWGSGPTGKSNKLAGTPQNSREITSELGAVCPTIVVPGPWSKADIKFQAEQIASQKLHNSGYNCIAMQTLVLSGNWNNADALILAVKEVMRTAGFRGEYYPGSEQRRVEFESHGGIESIDRGDGCPPCHIADFDSGDSEWLGNNEIFAPAFTIKRVQAKDAESYLEEAIEFANTRLYGTLGANIIIHPKTIKEIGQGRFEELLTKLEYGAIAINSWTGAAFLLSSCPWGGFPGATIKDPGSGIGTVHNTFMLENTERAVVEAPWRSFPRPPWFITNKSQHKLGRSLTEFSYKPSVGRMLKVFLNALKG